MSLTLSAQQLSQSPPTQVTASLAKAGAGPDAELMSLLDLTETAKTTSTTTSTPVAATPEHSTAETVVAPPAAFTSTRQLEGNRMPEFHKKIFMTEFAAYTAANIVDGITTVRGVQRGFTEASFPQGASEFLGRRPGAARYAVTMGAMQTAATFASYRLQHSHSRVLRMIGHSIMAEGIVDHTSGFVNNLMLGSHP